MPNAYTKVLHPNFQSYANMVVLRMKILEVNCSNISVEVKQGFRRLFNFLRGLEELALPTSPRWSTCAWLSLPLIHTRTKCTLWVSSSSLQHDESLITICKFWVGSLTTYLDDHRTLITTKAFRWYKSPRVISTNFHLTLTGPRISMGAHKSLLFALRGL